MTTKLKNNINDYAATILGIVMAIATDWLLIDWKTFEFEKDWKTLVLSAIIATGGILTKFKLFKPKDNEYKS